MLRLFGVSYSIKANVIISSNKFINIMTIGLSLCVTAFSYIINSTNIHFNTFYSK